MTVVKALAWRAGASNVVGCQSFQPDQPGHEWLARRLPLPSWDLRLTTVTLCHRRCLALISDVEILSVARLRCLFPMMKIGF
jgi:hypothetical protein